MSYKVIIILLVLITVIEWNYIYELERRQDFPSEDLFQFEVYDLDKITLRTENAQISFQYKGNNEYEMGTKTGWLKLLINGRPARNEEEYGSVASTSKLWPNTGANYIVGLSPDEAGYCELKLIANFEITFLPGKTNQNPALPRSKEYSIERTMMIYVSE